MRGFRLKQPILCAPLVPHHGASLLNGAYHPCPVAGKAAVTILKIKIQFYKKKNLMALPVVPS